MFLLGQKYNFIMWLRQDDENDSLHNVQLQLIRAIEKEAEMKKDLGELQLSYETMKTTYEQKLNSVERKKDEIKSSLEEVYLNF